MVNVLGFAIWQPSLLDLINLLSSSLTICFLFYVGRYPTHRCCWRQGG